MSENEKTSWLENLATVRKAFFYALRFAWQSAPRLTAIRLIMVLFSGVFAYLSIYVMGQWFDAMQTQVMGKSIVNFTTFLKSGLGFWMMVFAVTMIVEVVVSRLEVYVTNLWFRELSVNQKISELRHRSTFDVARCRSKELDDLDKEISNLPTGWGVRMEFSNQVMEMLRFLLPMIATLVAIFQVQPYYAVVMMVFVLPLMIIRIRSVSQRWALNKEFVPIRKEVGVLNNSIYNSGFFNMSKQWLQAPFLLFGINDRLQTMKTRDIAVVKNIAIWETITQVVMFVGFVSVLVHATWTILLITGSIGTLSVVINSFQRFMGNLQMLSQRIADQWFSAKGVILLEEQFFQMKPVVVSSDAQRSLEDSFHELRLENVDFVYPNDTDCLQVLNGVNLTIRAGEKVAIIGENGSGKSSTLSLFLREYDPCAGRVLVNGIDLRELKLADWFSEAVKVSQGDGGHISRRKVGEEIASSVLGQPVDEDLVWQVLRIVRLEEEIKKLPKALETQIGEDFGGRDFSGGIRQRFAIARALYRVLKLKASVFIGDELDTGVDATTADQIMEELLGMEDLTCVFVTHNLGQHLAQCDRVLFFEKGKLNGVAPHAFLLETNEAYRQLVEKDQKRRVSQPSAPIAASEE
jgi:ABC-type multidrug transport system fused ATPase/permease subunit